VLTVELKRDTLYRSIQWITIENIIQETLYRYIQWTTIESRFHKYRSTAYTRWHDNGQKFVDNYWVNGVFSKGTAKERTRKV